MPKIVKVRNTNPPDLSSTFVSHDTSNLISYEYSAQADIRLWLRLDADLTELSGYSEPITAYEDSPSFSIENVYSNNFKAAKFSDADNSNALITYPSADNALSFGDGSSDSPFSISLWLKKVIPIGTDNIGYLFAKADTNAKREFDAYYNPASNRIFFRLWDESLSGPSSSYSFEGIYSDVSIEDSAWHHICFTYDGTGGGSASTKIKLYVDGAEISTTDSSDATGGTYVAMEKVSTKFYIGAWWDGTAEFDGFISEFAVWSKVLSLNEIKAIYYNTYDGKRIKSGYLNLPPRIKLRNLDNRAGYYPTHHRMGDKDRSGKQNIFYEDLPIIFGSKIEDSFENKDNDAFVINEDGFDKNKWDVSGGMSIRKEVIRSINGTISTNRCAVFSGNGTLGKRYIRTQNKIRNPTFVYFELIQGPYNEGIENLNLEKPKTDHSIALEISTDSSFASYTTVKTFTPDSNQTSFFDKISIKIPPSKKIKLGLSDFIQPGSSYYMRLVQSNYSNKFASWAIRNITVKYANQQLNYPFSINTTSNNTGIKIKNNSIASPHTTNNLVGTGISVKGVADVVTPFKEFTENITPFNETAAIESSRISFFNNGLDPEIYPGFDIATKNKTKIIIDLSVNEETKFGVTNYGTQDGTVNAPENDTSQAGQVYMVYWNNNLKKWEKIGGASNSALSDIGVVHGGNFSSRPTVDTYIDHVFKRAALGFGPVGDIFKQASVSSDFKIIEKEIAAAYSKPIDNFNFPYGNQYVATASQYIVAKDIGITKPFLLENASIHFQSKLEVPGAINQCKHGKHANAYSASFRDETSSAFSQHIDAISLRKLTFFMLRQFEDKSYFENEYDFLSTSGKLTVKRGQNLVSGSREMLTYGQMSMILSGTNQLTRPKTPSIQEILNSPLAGDSNLIIDNWDSNNILSITGSYNINFKSRVPPKYKSAIIPIVKLNTDNLPVFQKKSIGRGKSGSPSGNRALVNGNTAEGKVVSITDKLPYVGVHSISQTTAENMDLTSPFLILPSDKLIFGWQYPPALNLRDSLPIAHDTGSNSMTLFGKSKLYLYGSQIVNNEQFHETTNQNLNSANIYEHIIGNEKIIDKWQVAYRSELSGSIISNAPYGTSHEGKTVAFEWWDIPTVFWRSGLYPSPKEPTGRLGAPILSTTEVSSPEEWLARYPAFSVATANAVSSYYKTSINNISFRDSSRIYKDVNGDLTLSSGGSYWAGAIYDDSSYGLIQGYGYNTNKSSDRITDKRRPVYKFNSYHFGFFADIIQQGKDGKFLRKTNEDLIINPETQVQTDAPVSIIFVQQSHEDDSQQKKYIRIDPADYLEDSTFQSSNLNIESTSSMPFIDDTTPRNRTYTEDSIIIT